MRYYLAVRDSDIFAFGECGGKHASINPHAAQFAAYRAAGISIATRQISQIREDLYRFSLSASSDKLNFPRGSRLQKISKWSKNGGGNSKRYILLQNAKLYQSKNGYKR